VPDANKKKGQHSLDASCPFFFIGIRPPYIGMRYFGSLLLSQCR
jgi:hypothetical protein